MRWPLSRLAPEGERPCAWEHCVSGTWLHSASPVRGAQGQGLKPVIRPGDFTELSQGLAPEQLRQGSKFKMIPGNTSRGEAVRQEEVLSLLRQL